MAMTVKTTSTPAVPVTDFNALKDGLRERYLRGPNVKVCEVPSHHRGYTQTIYFDEKMVLQAEAIFNRLKQTAQAGKCKETFSFTVSCDFERVMLTAIFEVFKEKIPLHIPYNYGGYPHETHSHFCFQTESPIELYISWDSANPYLNPKPVLQLPAPLSWGPARLNEERKKGNGDCKLIFGGKHTFSAHKLIVGSFCPFMRRAFENVMAEKSSGDLKFPEITDFSQEALEAFVTLMYTRNIDLSLFPPSTAIQFLELSSYLMSDALQKIAFDHLYELGNQLDGHHILRLCYLQCESPFDQLKDLCGWLLRLKPTFYESVLQGEVPAEELIMLIAVSRHYNIEPLIVQVETIWLELTTAQKTDCALAALAKNHLSLLELTHELCKTAAKKLAKDDPNATAFLKAYKAVNDRVFELEVPKIDVSHNSGESSALAKK